MVTKEEKRRIKFSAQLARTQVKAAESKRMLAKIKELERAEATIRELRRVRFGRSKLGRGLKLGGKVFRRGVAPAAKGLFTAAGRSGEALVKAQARAAKKPKKRKRTNNDDAGFVGGFDPNFRIV